MTSWWGALKPAGKAVYVGLWVISLTLLLCSLLLR